MIIETFHNDYSKIRVKKTVFTRDGKRVFYRLFLTMLFVFPLFSQQLFAQRSAAGRADPEAAGDIVINELMGSNISTLADQDGAFSDWLELYNSGAQSIDLTGWYLTDDSLNLGKWQFPPVSLGAGEYLVVFASGKDTTGAELHTNFKLSSLGEYLALLMPDSQTVEVEYVPNYPAQALDVSFGQLNGAGAYFSSPTPGAANVAGTVDLVLSKNSVLERSPNDTLIGTLITTDVDTNAVISYSLLDDAGGRFKVVGNKLLLADSSLINFAADTSHQIAVRTTYSGGLTLDRTFTIIVLKYYSTALLINEFMASNNSTLADEDGDFSDWVEIYNPSSEDVNLENWYLTDSKGNLIKWQFPAVNLPAGGYLIVFASLKNRTGSELHTNFKLSAGGEYIGLVQPNAAVVVSEYDPVFPPQTPDISYGLFNGVAQFFANPTPGSDNAAGLLPIDPLTVTPERGFYDAAFSVSIFSAAPDVEIRYTLDGSAPTETNGTVYVSSISITTTAVLRARAFKSGHKPSPLAAHSYLFLDDVIQQPFSIPGYPINNYSLGGSAEVPHDYEMDPEVVNDPAYSGGIIKGLKDIPTMSITVDPDSIFNSTGFYDGTGVIRRASAELMYANAPQKNEQVNCGIEAHSHKRLKRSLRLNFSSAYGASKWNSDIFKDAPVNGANATDQIKHIILRGGNNRSWARKWNPDATAYTEDQWFRDSQIAMSGYGTHGTFVHLYINGIYWGLYNPVERPDDHFSAAYFSGENEDWFAVSHSGPKAGGDATRYNHLVDDLVNMDMTDPANYAELQEYLDVRNFSDYLALAWYGGVTDWPQNNWWGGNQNVPAGPFRYYLWDAEWSWDVTKDFNDVNGGWVHPDFTGSVSGGDEIPQIWKAVRDNSDFMSLFADRVYLHCFNGGALTDSASLARWNIWNDYVRDAIIAESAKYGDSQASVGEPLRTRDGDWQPEVDAIAAIMNGNVARFIAALRVEGYYPSIDPPVFSQRGGSVANGFALTLTNPNAAGTVYYTSDGSDPRASGGGISANAQAFTTDIILTDSLTIKTRVLDGSEWSAIDRASFTVSGPPPPTVSLGVKIFLHGPYNTAASEMSVALNNAGLLPLSSPYAEDGRTISAMPADVVDWVLVELRSISGGSAVVSKSALLRKDGQVVADDGLTESISLNAAEGDYFIVIKHRNHLAVMSAAAESLTKTAVLYDFTTAQIQAFGTDPMIEIESGIFGMAAGDANGDGVVDGADRDPQWRTQNGTVWSYAKGADFNLDGGIDALDLNLFWRPNQGRTSQVPAALAKNAAFRGNDDPFPSTEGTRGKRHESD